MTSHLALLAPGATAALAVCAALAWTPAVRAETVRYTIDVPDGDAVTYLLDLDVRLPGTVSVSAEWSGTRNLSLRLIPPDVPWQTVHRSGPSPQSLQTVVTDSAAIGAWTLRVHSLAAAGGGTGTLTIELPDALGATTEPSADQTPVASARARETWMVAQPVPPGTPAPWLPFLRATERLRETVVGDPPGAPSDVCQWQASLLRFLDRRREELLGGGPAPAENTANLLDRMSSVARSVEDLRTSKDPLVAGPPPSEPDRREAWRKLRTTKLDPVESELDRILSMVRRDFASELEDEDWPARYVSCLTACERFFEQRVRVGETRARNRDLAGAQWPTILAAADALGALSELTPSARAAGESGPR